MDFRLGLPLANYLKENGRLGDCDLVSLAGGVKTLLSPEKESDRDFLLGQIGKSLHLHEIQEVILINHTDCGAYGGSSHFSSFTEERDFHIREMEKARNLVLSRFPSLKVNMVLAKIDPSSSVDFEEVSELIPA
ncbi:MAG: hypothetical protein Q7S70_02230 [bacterium]|nr:hypothetical protein [bacterium]